VIKGLYSAFSAMEAAWKYQEVLANNVANANTAGFKREVASKESFADVLLSQQAPVPAPFPARIQAVIGQIGTGSFIADFVTDWAQGALQSTEGELDLGLSGGFFSIETPGGDQYLTRDGRFGRDATGDLVTSQGSYVLDVDGQHINLPAERVEIGPSGEIFTGAGDFIAQIAVNDYTPNDLVRAGEGHFTATIGGTPIEGTVRQGYLERSNANLVEDMTSLLAVQRTFQANQTIISSLDRTLDQAAGQLGSYGQ